MQTTGVSKYIVELESREGLEETPPCLQESLNRVSQALCEKTGCCVTVSPAMESFHPFREAP